MAPARSNGKAAGKASSKPASSASSSATSSSSSGSASATKRMGSLSSFQTQLSFTTAPPPAPRPPSAVRNVEEDRKAMPPPPVPKRKGKEKARAREDEDDDDVIIIDGVEDDSGSPRRKRGLNDKLQQDQLWADVYGPTNETELAPGKQRIARVKNWLHEALYGVPTDYNARLGEPSRAVVDRTRKYRRILLVTGAAGIGKTTTIRLLAEQMAVELVEWTEGVDEYSIGGGFERESSLSKLSSFLSRSAYPSLGSTSSQPRVLLLTALPNISHIPTRDAFHAALLNFCQTFTPSACPLIIVHSDAGSGGRAEESWMDRERGGREGAMEIVGKAVKDGPWCQEIDFLPLAPTFLTKALQRVLTLATASAKRPSTQAVQLIALSSNGDLRSAINSLQLLCTKSTTDTKRLKTEANGKAAGKGARGGKGGRLDVSPDLRAILDSVTRREQSLNLFHALGKVLYNKRVGDPPMDSDDMEEIEAVKRLPPDDPLPQHLLDYERTKSMVQMEAFIPTIPVDASTFALWIHQNFPGFCIEIEQAADAMDRFCDADVMRTDDDIWQSSPSAIAYSLHLSIRGTLMALPSPVPRKSQKVVKPQFFEAYCAERDNTALLDSAAGYLTKRAVASSVALSGFGNGRAQAEAPWGGLLSRAVLVTEVVPMAVKIQSASKPILPASTRPLALRPYATAAAGGQELKDRDVDDDSYEAEAAGADGMGVVGQSADGWADEEDDRDEEDDTAWMADDDIMDFD
ncbi:RFC checkpoint protein Rad17 [Cryptotrichosporon argae]